MPNITRAFIVTDESMVKLGYVDKIIYQLRKRQDYVHSTIFAQVEADPSFDTIMEGVKRMNAFLPDVIIALGGGSAIDAAKGVLPEGTVINQGIIIGLGAVLWITTLIISILFVTSYAKRVIKKKKWRVE